MPRDNRRRVRDEGLELALWLLVVFRIGLQIVAMSAALLEPLPAPNGEWTTLVGAGGEPLWLSVWQRWDALWYQHIADGWYAPGDGTAHFEPLYPFLVLLLGRPLGVPTVLAQLVVSSTAFVAAIWLLWKVARLDLSRREARLAVLLTVCWPDGFFLLAPYTESLYLALTLAAFWLARSGRPWAAGLAGFLAGGTRTVGAFLVLPLAYEYLRRQDERRERWGPALLAATLPGLGLVSATLYLRLGVGEQRSMLDVAQPWGDHLSPPWQALAASWDFVVRTGGDPPELLNLVGLLAAGIVSIWLPRRFPLAYGLYAWPYMLLLFARESAASPLESVGRYLVVLFPMWLQVAVWLSRRPRLAGSLLAIGLLVQAVLLGRWVRFGFVG